MSSPNVAHDVATHRRRPVAQRVASAAGRRLDRLCRIWRNDRYPRAAEDAWQWLTAAQRGNGLPAQEADATPCPAATAMGVQCAADYGQRPLVERWASWLAEIQLPDGAVPDRDGVHPSHFNTAQAAMAWRRAASCLRVLADESSQASAKRSLAAAALAEAWLARSGNVVPATGHRDDGPPVFSSCAPISVSAALELLRSLQAQVRAEFANVAPHVEADAPPDGALARQIALWAESLGAGVAAEVGSGRGRWLDLLQRHAPATRWLAIDPAAQHCAAARRPAALLTGSACDLPLPSGSLSAVLTVESLEHTLLPQTAVAELCRVLRPGGQILVIDKPLARQPLSYCRPWERWFAPAEVSAWLGAACEEVRCLELFTSGAANRRGGPDFLAWQAVRRG